MACLIYQPHRANGAMKTTTELLSDRIVPRALFVATVDSHIWYFHMPYLRMLRDMGFQVEVAAAPVGFAERIRAEAVSYTHLRAHETRHDLVCRHLLEQKKTASPIAPGGQQ